MTRARIDPQLLAQLNAARASSRAVEAVIFLRCTARLDRRVDGIIESVQRRVGKPPRAVTIFKNLGSFLVVATPEFIDALLEDTEIEAAAANKK